MSSLVFVRDGRTLPFVPVTGAALAAIAEHIPGRRRAYARSLYLALLELANEDRGDRVAVTRKVLGERSGCSRELVSDLRPLLEAAGVVTVRERQHGGQVLEHEWTVIEPSETTAPNRPPVPTRHDPRAHEARLSLEDGEQSSGQEEERASTRDEFPDDLPSELHDVAVTAGKILKATALTRGQKREVTRAAVGHAVLTYPDRDHVKVARDVEFWLLHGKGARKPCADIVARFRNFLDGSEPMAGPPLPAGVAPIRSVRDERERGRQWGTERSVAIMHGASPEEAVRIANERVGV